MQQGAVLTLHLHFFSKEMLLSADTCKATQNLCKLLE